MRRIGMLCTLAIVVCGLMLVSGAQRRPVFPQPNPNARNQVNPEQNKVQVRQLFEEMFNGRNYGLRNQVFANNCTVHFGGRSMGIQEAMAEGRGWHNASPDLRININSMNVNGETVTVNWTTTGTHTGQGLGVKPTGKRINVRGTSRFTLQNGKIVEAFNEEYRPEVFRQIGVSKTRAFLFYATESTLAILTPVIPDRFWNLF